MMFRRDLQLSESFRKRRRVTRVCFLAGILAIVGAYRIDDPNSRDIVTFAGVALCLVVFPLYFRWCNRCPRCQRSFSDAPEYTSDETSGLPLFNSLARCPFCELDLDSARRYL